MRRTFSNEEIAELKKNPCVFNCTTKSVHYTYEFKRRAIEMYSQGIGPNKIWRRDKRKILIERYKKALNTKI